MQVKGRVPAESPTVIAVMVAYPPTRPHISTVPSFSPQTAHMLTLLVTQVDKFKEGNKRHTASRQ